MNVTYEQIIQKTTNEFKKWVNYTEKNKYSQLNERDYDNPGNYNENAGSNNYTVFAKLYKEKTGIDVQGQPWCDCFVDTIFIHLFGVDDAKKLLGGFSAYTPTSANYFKNMKRWYTSNPKPGDIIFFKNSTRICHTGYVYSVANGRVYTVEGNTSTTNNTVEANGGCVAMKYYSLNASGIAGYGRPNYNALVREDFVEGWVRAADNKRWWYQFSDGRYALNDGKNNGWYIFKNFYYLFDKAGYMLTGKQVVNDVTYYLEDESNSDEGKLLSTYGNGYGGLVPWDLSKYPETDMKKIFS